MSYEDGSGQIPRRPRVNDGPPPVSGVVAIVLAVIAVVAGYLILRSITDDGAVATGPIGGVDSSGGDNGAPPESTTPIDGSVAPTLPSTPAAPQYLVTRGAQVIVANANGKGGSAGAAARVLANSAHFELAAEQTNKNAATPVLDTSAIYFDATNPLAETVANSLNTVLGGALSVAPLGDPPIENGDMKGAHVLLMLGKDFQDMAPGQLDLTQIDPAGASGGATTATNPSTSPSSTVAPAG